jgi:hypothetical protein
VRAIIGCGCDKAGQHLFLLLIVVEKMKNEERTSAFAYFIGAIALKSQRGARIGH